MVGSEPSLLPPDACGVAQRLMAEGFARGLLYGSSKKKEVIQGNRFKLPNHSVEFLETDSPGCIGVETMPGRGQGDPLSLPAVAINCGVCAAKEFDLWLQWKEYEEKSGLPRPHRDPVSSWFWSWQSFKAHQERHRADEWGCYGSSPDLWEGLWNLATGKELPDDLHKYQEGNLKLSDPHLRLSEEFIKSQLPLTPKVLTPMRLHYSAIPHSLPKLSISICSDKKTEEVFSVAAVGSLIASRWKNTCQEARQSKLSSEARNSRNWISTHLFGLNSFSPAFFPREMIGNREGDTMVSCRPEFMI